jgi:hypothetical protein
MSKHAEITQGMSEGNIKLIKQGKAPIAPNAEQKKDEGGMKFITFP